jgi:hypothetical protein
MAKLPVKPAVDDTPPPVEYPADFDPTIENLPGHIGNPISPGAPPLPGELEGWNEPGGTDHMGRPDPNAPPPGEEVNFPPEHGSGIPPEPGFEPPVEPPVDPEVQPH